MSKVISAISQEKEEAVEADARRYRWLASEYAYGNETYLAESIFSKEQLDSHCFLLIPKQVD